MPLGHHDAVEPETPYRGRLFLKAAALAAACVLTAAFVGLGIWQMQRLEWKTGLIERVEARLAEAHGPAPGPQAWAGLNAHDDEYRRVEATGRYLPGHDTLVKAVTELGGGYWVMTPFDTQDGFRVLVNRGFVNHGAASGEVPAAPRGIREIRGLLRLSQPGGAFLRDNDAEGGRWFSRDVAAIAAAEGLGPVAPYFIDVEASSGARQGDPVGGLTVVTFRNTHLIYALTWFALAALLAGTVAATAIRRFSRSRIGKRG